MNKRVVKDQAIYQRVDITHRLYSSFIAGKTFEAYKYSYYMYIYVIYVLSFAHLSLFHTLVCMQNTARQIQHTRSF